MISFDERGGVASVNLNPIYSSLQMLSMVKLDSSVFTHFTNTITISGGGFPYLVDYSDGTGLNRTYLYNVSGTLPSDGIGAEQLKGYDMIMTGVSALSAGPYNLDGFKSFNTNSFQGTPTMVLKNVKNLLTNRFNYGTCLDICNYSSAISNTYSAISTINMLCKNGINRNETFSTNGLLNLNIDKDNYVSYVGNGILNMTNIYITGDTFNYNKYINHECYNIYSASWNNNSSLNLKCSYAGYCVFERFFDGAKLDVNSLVNNEYCTIPKLNLVARNINSNSFTSIAKLNVDCLNFNDAWFNKVSKANVICNSMTHGQFTQCSYMDFQGVNAYENSFILCNEKIRLSFGTITNLYVKNIGEITIECDELRSIRCENVNKCVVKCKTLRTPYWFFSISTLVLDYDSISYTYTYATDDPNMRDLSTVYMKNYTESNFYWSTPFGSHVDLHIQNKHDIFNGSTYTILWNSQYAYIGDTPVSLLKIA